MCACVLFRCLLMFAWPAIAIVPRQSFIGDGLDGDFTDWELKSLVMPDPTFAIISDSGESSQVTGSIATSVMKTVIFIKQNNWGSARVRSDEAAHNMRQIGWWAKSVHCEDMCGIDAAASRMFVHVKLICKCACSMPGTHFYDPVDQFAYWDNWETHLQHYSDTGCNSTTFVPQTKLMKTIMRESGLKTSDVLPHHHDNWLHRRHVMKDSSSFRIGLAGDFLKSKGQALEPHWLINLVDMCLDKIGSTGHEIKMLSDLSCDITAAHKSPSPHGDCIAQKLATLDLAIVWREESTINMGTKQTKPNQRLVNVMAVGVPFVADGTYASHVDVLHKHLKSPFLASSQEQLCTSIRALIKKKDLRQSASRLGLRLARHYAPLAIAHRYAKSLTAVAGPTIDTIDDDD